MKLIIDIDEDLFNELLQGTASNRQNDKILKCVKNATPLQAELEEIKAKIIACTCQEDGEESDNYNKGIDISTQILDNHIKKLKEI